MNLQYSDKFKSLYEIEAVDFKGSSGKQSSFWMLMLKASGIFITMTLIVFFVVNYQFIKAQMIDWKGEGSKQTTDNRQQ